MKLSLGNLTNFQDPVSEKKKEKKRKRGGKEGGKGEEEGEGRREKGS